MANKDILNNNPDCSYNKGSHSMNKGTGIGKGCCSRDKEVVQEELRIEQNFCVLYISDYAGMATNESNFSSDLAPLWDTYDPEDHIASYLQTSSKSLLRTQLFLNLKNRNLTKKQQSISKKSTSIKNDDDNNFANTTNKHVVIKRLSNLQFLSTKNFNLVYQQLDQEIKIHARLNSSHILKFISSTIKESTFGQVEIQLVYPYAAYGSCSDLLSVNFNTGLPYQVILFILFSLLQALVYLKANLVVHRSVRPEHVLVFDDGSVRLSCFRHAVGMNDVY